MKANKFVRKFGLGWARDVVNNQPKTDAQIFNPYNQKYSSNYSIKNGVSVAFLKRLVESHDLVELCGGLSSAKDFLIARSNGRNDKRLTQAIDDVESCL